MNLVEKAVIVFEVQLVLVSVYALPEVRLFAELVQNASPALVDSIEFGLFCLHLRLDVLGGEDWLQVHPPSLGLNPALECILNQDYLGFNEVGFLEDGLDGRVGFAHQEDIELIIQRLLHFIHSLEDESSCVLIGHGVYFEVLEDLSDQVELLFQTPLSVCLLADLLNNLFVVGQPNIQNDFECQL